MIFCGWQTIVSQRMLQVRKCSVSSCIILSYQINFFVGNSIAAKYIPEREGLAREVGISMMLFNRSVQILVKHFLRQLSNQTDARVVVSDTFLNVRLTPESSATHFSEHHSPMLSDISIIKEKISRPAHARALSCHHFCSGNQVLGCHQSGTAWICVVTVTSLGSQRCWFHDS